MSTSDTHRTIGGRYRLDRSIGQGGMGTVWQGHDELLGREVAVKEVRFPPELGEREIADLRERTLREARATARLSHPNVITTYDVVEEDDRPWIVMELLKTHSLSEVLRDEGPLPPHRVAEIGLGVLAALETAHAQGVVHRDVKPSNVLLGERGIVKLADLGIATAAEHTRITRSGAVLGTPAYMAPEQLDGGRTSPASDRYSLAAVAFEVLSGRRARTGHTPVALAFAIATEPPPDLREAWPEAPLEAAEVLKRGMARERSDRYSSAGEMATELASALSGAKAPPPAPAAIRPPAAPTFVPSPPAAPASAAPAPSPAPAAPRPAPRRQRRRVSPLLPLLLIAGALLVGGLVLLSSGGGDKAAPDRAGKTRPHATKRPQSSRQTQQSAPSPAGPAPAAPSGAAPAPASATGDGARLNDQGFRLMRAGRYADAVPILRRAVAAYPSGSTDLTYAYALFNLGRSLRLSGHPAEAIPILERRLRIPNQTAAVQQELAAARRAAGRG
jgi:serine/threonine protein kinase